MAHVKVHNLVFGSSLRGCMVHDELCGSLSMFWSSVPFINQHSARVTWALYRSWRRCLRPLALETQGYARRARSPLSWTRTDNAYATTLWRRGAAEFTAGEYGGFTVQRFLWVRVYAEFQYLF